MQMKFHFDKRPIVRECMDGCGSDEHDLIISKLENGRFVNKYVCKECFKKHYGLVKNGN